MKWYLVAPVCLFFFSSLAARADTAADLFTKGTDAMANNDYVGAATIFDTIITKYPTTANIDDIRIEAGYSYLHASQFDKAIDRLKKEIDPKSPANLRIQALFYTGQAQFNKAEATTDKKEAATFYKQTVATMSDLIATIQKAPSPETRPILEEGMYYKTLGHYQQDDYAGAVADLNVLLQSFPKSLTRPDYLLLLGSIYAVLAGDDIAAAEKTAQPGAAIPESANAQNAIQTFDLVIKDPNALVPANDASQRKAEVLYLLAQTQADKADGYAKALEAFHAVRRKADMITAQTTRLQELKQEAQARVQATHGAIILDDTSRLIEREENRLAQLTKDPDPIIQALIRIAECYVAMKQADEARTVLHRLTKGAQLTPEQQQEVDFQLIYSYVLGSQNDKADAALTDYLTKHPGDPQADSISAGIGSNLLGRKDYAGAIHQAERSLKDFPKGKHVADAINVKVKALTGEGKIAESTQVMSKFIAENPTSPVIYSLTLTKAENQVAQGDLNGALASYKLVRDTAAAGPESQEAAAAFYIDTLNKLSRYDDVIKEARDFATKYPASKATPALEIVGALAMDKKNDPGAIPALQAAVKQFPKAEQAPFALYYVIAIYQRLGKLPEMAKAFDDLRTAYPDAGALLVQGADAVGNAYVQQKKFDEAIAIYSTLKDSTTPAVAAAARNKVAGLWLASAKAKGSYQSMTVAGRDDVKKRLDSAEAGFLDVLKTYPDDLSAVGTAFQGLNDDLTLHAAWGLLKEPDFDAYLTKLTADLTAPPMPTRVELAKAGLVFLMRNGEAQYAGALDRFEKALSGGPDLALTRGEADQYGRLLIAAKNYDKAVSVYTAFLAQVDPSDVQARADAYYGLGAAALAKGDAKTAKDNFDKFKALPGGGAWSAHAVDVSFGTAYAAEQLGDFDTAKPIYADLITSPTAGQLGAKALLGYGRILEKTGAPVKSATTAGIEYATHYYEQVDLFYGAAAPELSAEGLYDAIQAYTKAGDTAGAAQDTTNLKTNYPKTEWAKKLP